MPPKRLTRPATSPVDHRLFVAAWRLQGFYAAGRYAGQSRVAAVRATLHHARGLR